jgi:GNAT superfamily N-acetyltransferase
MASQVRLATREDEPELLRLLHIMHSEGGLLPLDIPRAREWFGMAFDRKGGIFGVIDEPGKPGNIRAMIYLFMARYWYTKVYHIEEVFNFVRPDQRQTSCARELIEFAKDCAKQSDMLLVIGVLTNHRTEEKVRLYRRVLGLVPSGAIFAYNAKWVNLESSSSFWKDIFKVHKRDVPVEKPFLPPTRSRRKENA